MLTLPFPASVLGHVWTRMVYTRRDGRVNVPAAATDAWTPIAQFQVPVSSRGFLLQYHNEVLDSSYDYGGSLAWRIMIASSGFDALGQSVFTQLRGTSVQMADTVNYIQPGQLISLQVQRQIASGLPTVCTGSLVCLTWPIEIDTMFNCNPLAAPASNRPR